MFILKSSDILYMEAALQENYEKQSNTLIWTLSLKVLFIVVTKLKIYMYCVVQLSKPRRVGYPKDRNKICVNITLICWSDMI